MRRGATVLLAALALTACGGKEQWEGDLKLKVIEADEGGYRLERAQEMPRDAIAEWQRGRVGREHFPDAVQVGDEVICHVAQRKTGDKGFGTDVKTTNCRKA